MLNNKNSNFLAIYGSITEISSTGKLLGYSWGIIATLFTLHRLDFFRYL